MPHRSNPQENMTVQAKDCEEFVLVPKSLVESLKAKLDFRNREPPHCPTCSCGTPHEPQEGLRNE